MIDEDDLTWLESPRRGWTAITVPPTILEDNFVSGDTSGRRLNIRYFQVTVEHTLRAKVVVGPAAQGPPGHAHGGSMAAMLDEAMGCAAWMSGHTVVAAALNTRFRTMLPLGVRCIIEARVDAVDGRKIHTSSVLRDEDGNVYAESKALFITLDPKKFGTFAAEASQFFGRFDGAA